jgi:hypothetical protein
MRGDFVLIPDREAVITQDPQLLAGYELCERKTTDSTNEIQGK